MLLTFFILTSALCIGYTVIILALRTGLSHLKAGANQHQYFVSVVVAARNEEYNIRRCLQALMNQRYASDKYEIIIVDDRSTDNTARIVREMSAHDSRIKLIQIKKFDAGISPKKNAIEKGIGQAKGEIILTTDADCEPGPAWINTIVNYFTPDVGLVAGFSPLVDSKRHTFLSKFVTLDSLSLAAVAAGSFGLGKPLTCNGRNLAYRKQSFKDVGGFEDIKHFISGDDDLFLHLITDKTNWEVRYAMDRRAVVPSHFTFDLNQFANQRTRHASKGRHYSAWLTLSLTGVYFFNLLLLVLFPFSIIYYQFFIWWLILFGLKSGSEFLFLYQTAKKLYQKKILLIFPLAEVVHLFYVVIFGLWGQFGKFKWKDETFASQVNT